MNMPHARISLVAAALLLAAPALADPPYGLNARPQAIPYLSMPKQATGKFPALLSQTGAFADVRTLSPGKALIPYDLILAFWSDGAVKSRWISLPPGKIGFSPDGDWKFPAGSVFVKHFDLPVDDTDPRIRTAAINILEPVEADASVRQVLHSVANSDNNPQIRTVSRQVLSRVSEIQ